MTGSWIHPHRRWSLTLILSVALTAVAGMFVLWMLGLFLWQSIPVWRHEGASYVFGREWFFRAERFGILPMIYGSVSIAVIAVVIAAPMGVAAAVFTSEYLPSRFRMGVKVLIELLAGVPSVIYGLLGIVFLRIWVADWLEPLGAWTGDTLLTAGILLAIMILPTVMTLSEDALRSVSSAHRHAGRALGLTKAEMCIHVVLRQARPGIVAALLLGLGRAIGETIAVFLVVGRQDNQLPSPWYSLQSLIEPGQTLTSKLGGSEAHIAYGDPLHWGAMIGLGLILLVLVLSVTALGVWMSHRKHA